MRLRHTPALLSPRALGAVGLMWAAAAAAQTPAPVVQPPLSEGSAPALVVPPTLPELPELRLPDLREVQLAVPRPVRAAQAVLGMGKQRLALVVGLGQVGRQSVVDSATRNTQAVASALRSGGFVVMQREDLSAADLRGALKEFRERLQPGGVGFIYVTGLGAQVDGRNLLLPRDADLGAAAGATASSAPNTLAQRLKQTAVPLDEVTDALIGSLDSPRLLVVDAAWRHPALLSLPQAGLAQPRLPTGLMALFSHTLGSVQEVPAVAPLPLPAPTAAAEIAATPFVRTLVGALLKPRINGPEVLRSTRRAIAEATLGQSSPWLGGDTDDKEELAEASLLDGLIPRTPEEIAREALRQGSRVVTRPAVRAAGEQTVAEVLAQGSTAPATAPLTVAPEPAPLRPGAETPGASLGSTVGSAVSALGTAASVVATVAGAGVAVQAVKTAAAVSAASTAVGVAGSAASALGSTAVALAARAGSSSSGSAAAAGAAVAPAGAAAVAPAAAVAAVATLPAASPVALAAPGGATTATTAAALPAAAAATTVPATTDTAVAEIPGPGTAPAPRVAPAAAAAAEALPGNARPADAGPATATTAARLAPRRNPYGYTEGDRFSYQVVDTWADEVVGEYTTAIEEVMANGQLRANGQQLQMDAQGRPTRLARPDGSVSTFEPHQDLWWARPQGGERRAVKFLEKFQRADQMRGETEWRGGSVVARATTISTPAGSFDVLPIESSGTWSETLANGTRSNGQWSRTVYYSPQLQHPVAIDVRDLDALGRPLRRERIQLLHAQQARSTP